MPYLQQDPNEENGTPGQKDGSGGSGGAFVGGGGQGATSSVAGSPSTPAGGGGGYTNLLSYLGANQGAGTTMGQAAENVVQQSADDATTKQTSFQNDASNDIAGAASGVGVDHAKESAIKSGAATVNQDVMSNVAGAGANAAKTGKYAGPTSVDTSYKGPQSVQVGYAGPDVGSFSGKSGAEDVAAQAANQTVAGNAKNAQGGNAGVSALLRQAYQNPGYTTGESSLDAFLTGGTSGGQEALSKAAAVDAGTQKGYADVLSSLKGQAQGARDKSAATNKTYADEINAAKAQSAATGDTYQQAINGAEGRVGEYRAPGSSPPPATAAAPASAASPALKIPLNPNNGAGVSVPATNVKVPLNPVTGSGVTIPVPKISASPIVSPTVQSNPIQTISNAVTSAFGGGSGPGVYAQGAANDSNAKTASGTRRAHMADGGEVDDSVFAMPKDDDPSADPGNTLPGAQMGGAMSTVEKILPLLAMMNHGGGVPGKGKVHGDSLKNDTVPAVLSPKEIVLPRSVTLAANAPEKAAEFVADIKDKESPYKGLLKHLRGK